MPVALRQAPEGGETFEHANPNYGTVEPLEPTGAPFESHLRQARALAPRATRQQSLLARNQVGERDGGEMKYRSKQDPARVPYTELIADLTKAIAKADFGSQE